MYALEDHDVNKQSELAELIGTNRGGRVSNENVGNHWQAYLSTATVHLAVNV
jgi:hypothetical protein